MTIKICLRLFDAVKCILLYARHLPTRVFTCISNWQIAWICIHPQYNNGRSMGTEFRATAQSDHVYVCTHTRNIASHATKCNTHSLASILQMLSRSAGIPKTICCISPRTNHVSLWTTANYDICLTVFLQNLVAILALCTNLLNYELSATHVSV